MNIFTRVKYKNFFAAGNAPIEIPLNEHASTLIIGKNGVGKSTAGEAVCFAAFGRPLRNVNKNKLVNSINQRECLVELWFTNGVSNYHIKRGLKPAVFEIYENGRLIPQPADLKDYQTMLETSILHLNYKSFMQVVVLGSASYIPFMRLTGTSRRDIIEDLLDIEVFSSMNALTKEDAQTLRIELDKLSQATTLLSKQREMAETFTVQIEEQRAQTLQTLENSVNTENVARAKLITERSDLMAQVVDHEEQHDRYMAALAKQKEYEKTLDNITRALKKAQKERQFYEQHDTCPTCEQSITSEFKQDRFATLAEKETAATKASAQCEALIQKYETKTDEAREIVAANENIFKRIHAIDATLLVHERRLAELRRQIAEMQKPPVPTPQTVDVAAIDAELHTVQVNHEALSRRRVIVDAANMLLKDNGIKSRVIKHYLPIINKTINHYLNAMDFPILFTLDEEFNESIKSRHRDEFVYELFSEGEKKRIDLALLLTWRAVARMKNSASTNLLILDEVFDSSLDAAGTEEFLKIINALEASTTNVFVMSHKGDQLVDKFTNVLTFEKNRGFSELKV